MNNYKVFYHLLFNNLIAGVTNTFVWFALTFWVYIETQSVLATSFIAGIFAVANMLGALMFGTIVDHTRKKTAMLYSSFISLASYFLGTALYFSAGAETFNDPTNPLLWLLVVVLMVGSVAGNLRMIALSTSVTMLFDTDRDKVNGLVGSMQGISFSLTSILSGLAIGFYGMDLALVCASAFTLLALTHLAFITLPEKEIVHVEGMAAKVDFFGTLALVGAIPGLLALIFFHTFNNFLGGVFMALMDAYGLSMVSVETWGFMWGVLSLSMIAGGLYVSKFGVGKNPLRTIMIINLISWSTCIFFPLHASIIPLSIGMFVWLLLMPIAEAAEQTLIQNVVPFERQGRVFGFAQSIEGMATPVTTFLIGPLAHFVFIPFMTTGAGVALIGDWFGTGADRGIALVFISAGIIGVCVTTLAFLSKSYKTLSRHYLSTKTIATTE